jgi:hypothetical protein
MYGGPTGKIAFKTINDNINMKLLILNLYIFALYPNCRPIFLK